MLPGDRDGHVLAFGIEDSAGRVRGRAPRPRRHGGVDHRAGRRRLPRPSVLDRRNPGHARAARHRLGHRGLQRGLRARARPRALHRPLGRAARRGQVVLRDRERRQPPPGLRLRPRLDLGPVRADGRGRARRAPHAAASTARRGRASRPSSRVEARSRSSAIRAARSGSSSGSRAGPPSTPGRLGYRYGGEILATTPTGSSRPRGSTCPRAPRMRGSRSPTPAAAGPGRTHCDTWQPGGKPRAPSWHARRSTCSWSAAASSEPGSRARLRASASGVALVDRSDFGGATSSASSKLIHGGLRYLRLGDVKLVREAHAERRALLRVVAPHLVRRIPFMFPVYRGGPYRPATIQAGLWTYSTLAGDKLGGLVKPERARRSVPALRLDGLRGCGVYQDSWTHDGRLCLANVTAAAEAGATVLNYAEVVELAHGRRRRARSGAARPALRRAVSVEARAVVNATGPWLDELRRLEEPGVEPYGQLSKGVHVTLPLDEPWSSALTIPHDQVRVTFAYPWEGMLLLGTTDTPYEGDPADVDGDGGRHRHGARRGGGGGRCRRCCGVTACWRRTPACACCPATTARPSTPAARPRSSSAAAGC